MKKLLDFFKKPPLWFLIVDSVIAVGAMAGGAVFLSVDSLSKYIALGYVFLGIMAVTVSYAIYGVVKTAPDISERALKWSENKPFWNKLFTEYGFRAIIAAIGSFAINIAFAVYNGAIGIMNRSVWYGALSAYYILLMSVRGGMLLYHSKRQKDMKKGLSQGAVDRRDRTAYGICGGALVLLPVALSFAIMQMVGANKSFVHSGLTIYVYALYAFYKIIKAIYNFVKTRRDHEMTVRALKNISLADAMVSILALQTAMFHEFDSASDFAHIATMNAVTGAIVCALTAAIGIIMIVIACKKARAKTPA